MDLKGRHFLTLKDYTPEEITYLLDLAADLKDKKKQGVLVDSLRGKNVALIFEKTSTRTRCAFEVAAHDLGMGTTYLDPSGSQIGKKESIADTARVLGRMYEGIEYRGFGQEIVEELAKYAGVPVWNGLTNEDHPTQMLADLLTIREHLGCLKGLKLVYMGDARYNMGNSLMIACTKMGMHFVACAPAKYFPDPSLVKECEAYAAASGGSVTLTEHVAEAVKGADIIDTDVWVSMGEPDEVWEERIEELTPYKVTKAVMDLAGPNAIFLHCLPSFHDLKTKIGKEMGERFNVSELEVTDEVFESGQSVVFDEAENRMHTIKAVMLATLGESEYMQGQRGRSERHSGVFLDMVHLILGIAIVILAVLSFINPEGNHMLFPLVFLLAALLNAVNGIFELKTRGRDKKKFGASILQLALAAGLMVLGIVSAISIWA